MFCQLNNKTISLMIGAHTGIRTQTVWILSPLTLPVGLCGQMVRQTGFEPIP